MNISIVGVISERFTPEKIFDTKQKCFYNICYRIHGIWTLTILQIHLATSWHHQLLGDQTVFNSQITEPDAKTYILAHTPGLAGSGSQAPVRGHLGSPGAPSDGLIWSPSRDDREWGSRDDPGTHTRHPILQLAGSHPSIQLHFSFVTALNRQIKCNMFWIFFF